MRTPLWLKVLGGATLIVAVFVGYFAAVIWLTKYPNGPGEFGDTFGGLNALVAALAFSAIVFTIYQQKVSIGKQQESIDQQRESINLQSEELKLNTKELAASANALNEQVRLMRLSARLAALPQLIADTAQTVKSSLGIERGPHFPDHPSLELVQETIRKAGGVVNTPEYMAALPYLEKLEKQVTELDDLYNQIKGEE